MKFIFESKPSTTFLDRISRNSNLSQNYRPLCLTAIQKMKYESNKSISKPLHQHKIFACAFFQFLIAGQGEAVALVEADGLDVLL